MLFLLFLSLIIGGKTVDAIESHRSPFAPDHRHQWYNSEFLNIENKDLYQLFNIQPDASEQEIKKTYFTLSKQYHPDHNKHAQATLQFQNLHEAYKILQKKCVGWQVVEEQQSSTEKEEPTLTMETRMAITDPHYEALLYLFHNRHHSSHAAQPLPALTSRAKIMSPALKNSLKNFCKAAREKSPQALVEAKKQIDNLSAQHKTGSWLRRLFVDGCFITSFENRELALKAIEVCLSSNSRSCTLAMCQNISRTCYTNYQDVLKELSSTQKWAYFLSKNHHLIDELLNKNVEIEHRPLKKALQEEYEHYRYRKKLTTDLISMLHNNPHVGPEIKRALFNADMEYGQSIKTIGYLIQKIDRVELCRSFSKKLGL